MLYTALLPKSNFRINLTRADEELQPRRGSKTLSQQLQDHCPLLADPKQAYYTPSWVVPHGDLQTMFLYTQHFKPAGCPIEFEREVFGFSDGGVAAVDWALPRLDVSETTPLVLLIPGIGGCSFDYYARSFIQEIQWAPYGYQVVVLQSRGINGVDLVTPKMFHGGLTDDIREFVDHLVQVRPSTPIIGIGFSLGANMLTKYVGEEGAGCRLVAAVSVCNPFDIDTTISKMCEPTIKNRYLYAKALLASLKGLFNTNVKVISAGNAEIDPAAINAAKDINEFNEKFSAKAFGYGSAKELNQQGSCVPYLKNVAVPMLFLNALDDPMCYRCTIPSKEIESNPNLVLACTRYGGHLAYFETTGLTPWLPKPLAQYLKAMLEWK
ncbi:hypothetical protein FBU59_000618 [Linderina macrospora]|uniref:Uncharacterized protein n=1 Tax=Linderina macrospora TaxID=4868 RepID=A0ACC1JGP1_9FUNG|nr:hypothetical protein FBU59_000618 [Linderina macrospora]